jgi:uncharacterized sodium:solute symporter family permease YidK
MMVQRALAAKSLAHAKGGTILGNLFMKIFKIIHNYH